MEGLKSPGMQFHVILYVGTNVPGIHTTSIFRVKNILQIKTLLYWRWRQQIQPKGWYLSTQLQDITSVLLLIVAKTAKLSVNYWQAWQTHQDLTTKGDVAPSCSWLTANEDRISSISLCQCQSHSQILVHYPCPTPRLSPSKSSISITHDHILITFNAK